ncbi:MAG: DNA polymerase III subunit gamma/tau [Chlamydiae bacterium]|nr:DNA polymerase III subunit gamma/tau [Chlamydiota bacterium]
MQMYQPIARKYRPKLFKEVFGQQIVIDTLQNAIKNQRVAANYLFSGTRGTGKTTIARLFARAINCENLSDEAEPCNHCASCLQMLGGASMELMEIDGASNRGIDDIRLISEGVAFAPPKGRFRVYLIDEVHMLTKEAFNALLKTLEEPPSYVKFFFATTEPHKVPLTIQSRCQKFDLQRIRLETIISKLESIVSDQKLQADFASLSLIAEAAQGSMRDAESLLDQLLCTSNGSLTIEIVRASLGKVSKEGLFTIDRAIQKRSIEDLKKASDSLLLSGKETSLLIEDLAEHLRNHLLCLQKSLDAKSYHLSEAEYQTYQELSQNYNQASLLEMLELIYPFFHQPTRPFLSQQQFETLLILLMKKNHRPSISAIVERLEELEKKLVKSPSFSKELSETIDPSSTLRIDSTPVILNPPIEHNDKKEQVVPIDEKTLVEEIDLVSAEEKIESKETVEIQRVKVAPHPPIHETLSTDDQITDTKAAQPVSLDTQAQKSSPSLTLLPASVRHQNLIQFAIVEWNAVPQ